MCAGLHPNAQHFSLCPPPPSKGPGSWATDPNQSGPHLLSCPELCPLLHSWKERLSIPDSMSIRILES